MKYKVLKLDRNNKITFTKEELEELLNNVYEDGRKDGYSALFFPTIPEVETEPTTTDIDNNNTTDWLEKVYEIAEN